MTVDWLRDLSEQTTEYHPPRGKAPGFSRVLRQVTAEEWARIVALTQQEKLIVHPFNACFGFNLGISLYAHPLYPGLDPDFMIELTGEHFGERFDAAWERFSPLSHTLENGAQLARYDLFDAFPLRDKDRYAY